MGTQQAKLEIREYYVQLCEELGIDPYQRSRELQKLQGAKGQTSKPARQAGTKHSRVKPSVSTTSPNQA